MSNNLNVISQRKATIIAGSGLLIMAIIAPFANFNILQVLIVKTDALLTVKNIIASQQLFRIGICLLLLVSILDILVAWAFNILFNLVNKEISLLMTWFRIIYAGIFIISLSNLLNVLHLLSSESYLTAIKPDQLNFQVMIFINAFQTTWDFGLIIFGIHLLILGYLVFKSGYFPKFLGILVVIAGGGYMSDSVGKLLFSDYKLSIGMFTFIGEVLLIFWLFRNGIRGFNLAKHNQK